jgi:ethanolamine utilization microcompartment shell protein EutS
LSTVGAIAHTDRMITKNIGMLLLAIYLIAVGILTLTGLGIGIITGVLALLAGIFILIGR